MKYYRVLLMLGVLLLPLIATSQTTLYVSPTGQYEACTENRPCSLQQALDKVAKLTKKMRNDIIVEFDKGTYVLEESLILSNEHGGKNGYNVIYKAKKGTYPIISGGMEVTNWELHDEKLNIWKTSLNKYVDSRQLYVNGKRAVRARSERGLLGIEATVYGNLEDHPYRDNHNDVHIGYFCLELEMVNWKNQSDIEFVYKSFWTNPRAHVESIEPWGKNMVKISMKDDEHFWVKNKGMSSPKGGPWYVENVYELLDRPGEFYLSKSDSTVFYLPHEGEDLNQSETIIPVKESLVVIEGKSVDGKVENIHFQGLTFNYTTWLHPNERGFPDAQNGVLRERFFADGSETINGLKKFEEYPNYVEYLDHNGAMVVKNGKDIKITGCEFSKLGYIATLFLDGSQNCTVEANRFTDISHTAIQLGDDYNRGNQEDYYPSNPNLIHKNHIIRNNYINDVAKEFRSASGIGAVYPVNLTIEHNEIGNLPYCGIHLGWGWSYIGDYGVEKTNGLTNENPPPTKNVLIQRNYIHHTLREVFDGAHIYTLGATSGNNEIRENYLAYPYNPYGALYPDEGTNEYRWVKNVVNGGHEWLHINSLSKSIIDSTYINVSMDAMIIREESKSVVKNTILYEGTDFPEEAKKIVEKAGLEPKWIYLKKGLKNE